MDMLRLRRRAVKVIRPLLPMSVLFAFASKTNGDRRGFKNPGGGVTSGYFVPSPQYRGDIPRLSALAQLPDGPMPDGEGGNMVLRGCFPFISALVTNDLMI